MGAAAGARLAPRAQALRGLRPRTHRAPAGLEHLTAAPSGAPLSTLTGTALNAAFPVSASITAGSVMSLTLAPGFSAACRHPDPGAAVPEAVDRPTTPGRISSPTSSGTSIAPTRETTHPVAVAEPACARVVGMQQGGAPVGALHQPGAVVHPRVAAAQLAADDERQVVAVGHRVLALARVLGELRRLLDEQRRREADALASRVERAREARPRAGPGRSHAWRA